MSFSQLLNIPSSPPDSSSTDQDIASQIQAIIGNDNTAPFPQTNHRDAFEPFRPSSAHSHTHSHSASEYSYSSTDIDTDSVMSENSFALQPSNDNATDLGFGGMNLSMNDNNANTTTNHFWMDANHNQAAAGGIQVNGVKREAEWERLGTVAPNSVSPPEQSSSGRVASGSPGNEDDSSRAAKLERKSTQSLFTLRIAADGHRRSQTHQQEISAETPKETKGRDRSHDTTSSRT